MAESMARKYANLIKGRTKVQQVKAIFMMMKLECDLVRMVRTNKRRFLKRRIYVFNDGSCLLISIPRPKWTGEEPLHPRVKEPGSIVYEKVL